MSANPHANGGLLLRDLRLPDFRDYAGRGAAPGAVDAEATRVMGKFLRDVMKLNLEARNFRLFSPDENNSNRWQDVLEVTDRAWMAEASRYDDHLAPDGRVMEMLSEHQCQGWLEGYLLTGRHGFFSCYEAFIHIIDSMFNQHAKWLKVCNHIPWRRPIASLNYLLEPRLAAGPQRLQPPGSGLHRPRGEQEGRGDPRLPAARRQLPAVGDRPLPAQPQLRQRGRRRQAAGAAVADDGPGDQALHRRHRHLGVGEQRSGAEPDVVMACCGDVPTLETLAAVDLLRRHAPDLKVRVVNVVDLMRLQPPSEHPHGLTDRDFDALFTTDKPIIFAFHGYPWLIHRLTYRRTNHDNLHVRGYKEEGTTTTPFDMVRAERPGPLPPGRRRHRPGAEARRARRLRQAGDPHATATTCPRSPDGPGAASMLVCQLDRSRQRLTCSADAMNLFCIRHGETEWSLKGQHTGVTDIRLPTISRNLAKAPPHATVPQQLSLVLVSPLKRALETCALAGLSGDARSRRT